MSDSIADERIAELERKVERLTQLLEASGSATKSAAWSTGGESVQSDGPVSRRAALRTAGVLAAGAIAGGVGMVASATPAAAATASYTADGSNPALTAVGDAAQSAINASTLDPYIATITVSGPRAIEVDATQSVVGTAVRAIGGAEGTGVYAEARSAVMGIGSSSASSISRGGYFTGDIGVVAVGFGVDLSRGIGMVAVGERSAIKLEPLDGRRPQDRSGIRGLKGMIDIDQAGDTWLCTQDGTPGTWRKISGPSAAGAFHAIAPVRAYDSRKSGYTLNGVIAKTTNRTVSVADSHNTTTGALVTADVVPVGATAVAANVTVTGTIGSCYFCVNPGGTTTLGASTINWFGSGQILANGVILTLDANRQVTIVAGDSLNPASAHCIIDITGYWL